MMLPPVARSLATLTATALLAGCAGTSVEVSAANARKALGAALIGTEGATAEDQHNINETIAGGCAVGIWAPDECAAHGEITRATVSDDG